MKRAVQRWGWISTAANVALMVVVGLMPSLLVTQSAQAQTFSVLYNFTNSPDGASPDSGGLVLDAAGNLYGTTFAGGAFFHGTVFKLDTAGTETVLYTFRGLRDGADPIGGVVLDAAGNLYGTTSHGGLFNAGTVFKLSPSGRFKVLHTFAGGVDGSQPYAGLMRDHHGNLYGTAKYGGASGHGTVFKVDATGKGTVLYAFTGYPDGGQPTAGLIGDAAGNFYGTTSAEGLFHYGTVFRLDRTTGQETVLHDFTGAGDGIFPSGVLARDAAGNLYGTTSAGGPFNLGMGFQLDASGRESVLINFGGADGSVPMGGWIRDAAGTLYGTTAYGGDYGPGAVVALDTFAGFRLLHSFSAADGNQPFAGLIQDAAGNLYGTTRFGGTSNSGVIFKIVP